MNHADHVRLLARGVDERGGLWADLGAGAGAFTLALADLIGPQGRIFAVDSNGGSLRRNAREMGWRFPGVDVVYMTADFTSPLELRELDGIVMANSLHFQRDQAAVLTLLYGYVKPGGRMIAVEYEAMRPSAPVPYPVPFERWKGLAEDAGFEAVARLAARPSRWLGEIYSTMALRPGP